MTPFRFNRFGPRSWVLMIIAMLLLGEACCRLAGYPHNVAILASSDLGWMPIPNQQVRDPRGAISINSHGFRDHEWNRPQPPSMRIAILGDSVTFGTGVPAESRYSDQLQLQLNALEGSAGTQVMNFAVPGFTIGQMTNCYQNNVQAWEPDLVIIALNDGSAAPASMPPTGDWVRPLLIRSALFDWLNQWCHLRTRSTRPSSDPDSQTQRTQRALFRTSPFGPGTVQGWQELRSQILSIQTQQASHEGRILILPLPRQAHMQAPKAEHSAHFLGDWLTANQLATCQPMPAFRAAWQPNQETLFLANDPVHWTALAHRLTAESLVRSIVQLTSD